MASTGSEDLTAVLVDQQVGDLQSPGPELAGPAQDGPGPGQQLGHHKWFEDVVVGARLETGQPIGHRVAGGQEQHRGLGVFA